MTCARMCRVQQISCYCFSGDSFKERSFSSFYMYLVDIQLVWPCPSGRGQWPLAMYLESDTSSQESNSRATTPSGVLFTGALLCALMLCASAGAPCSVLVLRALVLWCPVLCWCSVLCAGAPCWCSVLVLCALVLCALCCALCSVQVLCTGSLWCFLCGVWWVFGVLWSMMVLSCPMLWWHDRKSGPLFGLLVIIVLILCRRSIPESVCASTGTRCSHDLLKHLPSLCLRRWLLR